MNFPEEQVSELNRLFPGVQACEEGGTTFLLIPNLKLPDGCKPEAVDALFCPTARDGYTSRLFFAEKVKAGPNWNGAARVLERNWFAFSWKVAEGLRLAQMVAEHLRGLRT